MTPLALDPFALCSLPLRYFSPSSARATGQKLASTSPEHSVLVAPAPNPASQLTTAQRLSSVSHTAYGLPYEVSDHV